MGEFNPYNINDFAYDILKVYLEHGYGNIKLCETTFFGYDPSYETESMTLKEFKKKVDEFRTGGIVL